MALTSRLSSCSAFRLTPNCYEKVRIDPRAISQKERRPKSTTRQSLLTVLKATCEGKS